MLNSEFNEFAKHPEVNLYPEDLVGPLKRSMMKSTSILIMMASNMIEETVDLRSNLVLTLAVPVSSGVYRCGFATTQSAYDTAIDDLTKTFDQVDRILQGQRFLTGNKLTLADMRLFVSLVRLDEICIVYFKTNTRAVTHTPALLNYCRDVYRMPGVADTLKMEQIKTHYYASHPMLNRWSVIPRGADFEKLLQEPHSRHAM